MLMTKEQISAQRKLMEEQLKMLEEQEKNYEKKAEGLQKLQELEEKYYKDRDALAKKYYISQDELKNVNAPKPVFSFSYKSPLGMKTYDWFPGKIGKSPKEWEIVKSQGVEAMMHYATEFGKQFLQTEEGKIALKNHMAPKKPKKATTTVAAVQAAAQQPAATV